MKITPQEQLLHELLAEVQGVKATVADVAERLTRLEAGQPPVSQFLQSEALPQAKPSKAKQPKPKAKPKTKAKPSSPARQAWKLAKAWVKARGLTQEFYRYMESFKRVNSLPLKLQGEDYFVVYNQAFERFEMSERK